MTEKEAENTGVAEKPPTIDQVVREVREIATLPQVATKVIEVAKDPDAGAADLKAVVEGDPVLSARVLRMVNSASCGMRAAVSNLHQAISYLGFRQVRNLALTASVSEMFRGEEGIGCYRRDQLWKHLVSVGVCARMVAARCRIPNFDDAFLAGLLHDVGIIIEDQQIHEHFRGLIGALTEGRTLASQEREWIGFDHCELGAYIAEIWKFPASVQAAIRHHHASHRYKGVDAEIVACVEIANVICTIKGISSVGIRLVEPPSGAFRALGFKKADIVILATDLDQELAMNENLFEQ